jgi:hypothetical protein
MDVSSDDFPREIEERNKLIEKNRFSQQIS